MLLPWFCLIVCATGEIFDNRRIYNGIRAKPEYIYQAAIATNEEDGRTVICGGAIIDDRHVLTAGHCLETGPMSVRVGSENLDDTTGTWHEVIKYVSPYINNTYSNDIAILNIDPAINFTDKIKPIQLPDGKKYKRLPKKGTVMTVSGWGFVNTENKSDYLLSIDLKVITERKCRKRWPTPSKKRICVQGSGPGFGTCGGDSGGPLVHNHTLYGILSYGTENCSLGAPEVYTRVYSYMPWIKKQLHNFRKKSFHKLRYEHEPPPRKQEKTDDEKSNESNDVKSTKELKRHDSREEKSVKIRKNVRFSRDNPKIIQLFKEYMRKTFKSTRNKKMNESNEISNESNEKK